MTLKQFISYLHRHTHYSFSKHEHDDEYVMRFGEDFRGHISKENDKFFIWVISTDVGAALTMNRHIVCKHILSYRLNLYYI